MSMPTAMRAHERPPVYADENLDRPLIEALRTLGFDVLTMHEAGLRQASDERQLAQATRRGCVLLTHDRRDFRRLHTEWAKTARAHAGIAAIPQAGPVARRAIRAALLIDWMVASGGPTSRFTVWGQLQTELRRGHRVEGYTEHDVRVALGLVEP
jgi:hypothetical protein